MLAPIFFSSNIQLASFGAFAAGFFARPLGAIVFGMIGDKHGRKIPLVYSMTLVGIPTLLIGLTPGHLTIGALSPCILITCRILQGFFNGGEFAGVNLIIAENENNKNMGANAGLLISAGVFGSVFAAGIGAITVLDIFPSWCWRLSFIFGGFASLSLLFATSKFHETKEFRQYNQGSKILISPWHVILSSHKLSFMFAVVFIVFTLVPLYLSTIFGNQIFQDLGYSHSESMGLNGITMIIDGLAIVLFGKLSDKIGFQRQITFALVFAIAVGIPTFHIISFENSTVVHTFLFILPLALIGGMTASCGFIYVSKLFPINCRYSALALSITLGQALFGGTTPFVASYLVNTWETKQAPAYWLICLASLTLIILILKTRQTRQLQIKGSVPAVKTAA